MAAVKWTAFWDVMSCCMVEKCQSFGKTCLQTSLLKKAAMYMDVANTPNFDAAFRSTQLNIREGCNILTSRL